MQDEDYFVQVTYRRPPPPEPAAQAVDCPTPSKEAEKISAELTGQQPLSDGSVPPVPDELVPAAPLGKLVPCMGGTMRVLTPEEKEREMAESRQSDNPRVRAMFDMIDKHETHQPLPEGVRVRQGDLFAPGLVITANPFPDWFDHALRKMGQFDFDSGCISYTKQVTGKPEAERWAEWVIQILENERKDALSSGRKPLCDTTEVVVREDHRALLNDVIN